MLTGTKAPRTRRSAALAAVALTSITALMLTACATTSQSPSDPLPTGSPAVTVSLHPDFNVHVKAPKPVVVTAPAAVRGLTSLINGLPNFPSGTFDCPMDGGARLTLSFSTTPGGPARTVATVNLGGCQSVSMTVDGRQQQARGGPDGGRAVATQALKIGGVPWNLGHYL
jgi:hypothetical protein